MSHQLRGIVFESTGRKVFFCSDHCHMEYIDKLIHRTSVPRTAEEPQPYFPEAADIKSGSKCGHCRCSLKAVLG